MSWRRLFGLPEHEHDYELVGKTHSKGMMRDEFTIREWRGDPHALDRMIHGVTTLTYKCSDSACGSIVQSVSLGAPVDPDPS